MQWRARVVAPVLAGVLGVTGGVAVALATQQTVPVVAPFDDPLNLGVPLQNLPCNAAESILVVGHGENGPALDSGVANSDGQAKYLRTADSCQTQLIGDNAAAKPTFIAYTGPYSNLQTPCEQRMTFKHAKDYVARLRPDGNQLVKCPCVLPSSAAPVLTKLQKRPAADSVVWVRALQSMLNDDDPQAFPRSQVDGIYNEVTRRYILTKFQTPAGLLGRSGSMDEATWSLVTEQICPQYTY